MHKEEGSLVGQTDRRSSHSPSWALPSQKESLKPLGEGQQMQSPQGTGEGSLSHGGGGVGRREGQINSTPLGSIGICSVPRTLGISCLGGKDKITGIKSLRVYRQLFVL